MFVLASINTGISKYCDTNWLNFSFIYFHFYGSAKTCYRKCETISFLSVFFFFLLFSFIRTSYRRKHFTKRSYDQNHTWHMHLKDLRMIHFLQLFIYIFCWKKTILKTIQVHAWIITLHVWTMDETKLKSKEKNQLDQNKKNWNVRESLPKYMKNAMTAPKRRLIC